MSTKKLMRLLYLCPRCSISLDKKTFTCKKCGYDRCTEIAKGIKDSQKKQKERNDKLCSEDNHQMYLRHVGFGGGKIYWICTNCQREISEDDQQMTF